jgi:hypothetical protein
MFPLAVVAISSAAIAAILAVIGVPLVLVFVGIAVLVLLAKRTSNQPGGGLPNLTHTPVDWGIFTGLLQAVQSNDKGKVLAEIGYLSKRAGEAGGVEGLLEEFLYSQLEVRLSDPSKRTPLLTEMAKMAGVSARQLLDVMEGKANVPATAAPAAAVAVPTAVKAGLLVLCATLFGASEASAVPPLRSPERFEAAEVSLVIDPPVYRTASISQCNGICPQPAAVQAMPQTFTAATFSQPTVGWWAAGPARRVASAPIRWLFCR